MRFNAAIFIEPTQNLNPCPVLAHCIDFPDQHRSQLCATPSNRWCINRIISKTNIKTANNRL